MPPTQDVSVHIEDGKCYIVTLYNGRLDGKALDKSLAQDSLVLKTLNGVIPAFDGNDMSRTIVKADIRAQTQPRKDPPSPAIFDNVMTAILWELKILHMQSASQGIFMRYTIRKTPSNRAKKAV